MLVYKVYRYVNVLNEASSGGCVSVGSFLPDHRDCLTI